MCNDDFHSLEWRESFVRPSVLDEGIRFLLEDSTITAIRRKDQPKRFTCAGGFDERPLFVFGMVDEVDERRNAGG